VRLVSIDPIRGSAENDRSEKNNGRGRRAAAAR